MYLIDIRLKGDQVTEDQLTAHRQWFSRHFEAAAFCVGKSWIALSITWEMTTDLVPKYGRRTVPRHQPSPYP